MEFSKFIQIIPQLYDTWRQNLLGEEFLVMVEQFSPSTTAQVMQYLNLTIDCLKNDEIYLQLGDDIISLIAALSNHHKKCAYLVSLELESEEIEEALSFFNLEDYVFYFKQSLEDFLSELKLLQQNLKIGVFYYQGSTDYRNLLLSLLFVKNFLAEEALIFINSNNDINIQQACYDFISTHPNCQPLDYFCEGNGTLILQWNSKHQFLKLSLAPEIESDSTLNFSQSFEVPFKKDVCINLEQQALSLFNHGQLSQAEEKFQQLLISQKNYSNAYHGLALIYYKQGHLEKALKAISIALNLEQFHGNYYYSLGLILEAMRLNSQAIEAYQKAIKLSPEKVDAYNNLGSLFLKSGQLDEANIIYRMAIAANPKYDKSYFNLLFTLHKQGKTVQAIEVATQTSEIFPKDFLWQLKKYLMLPIIYDHKDEIIYYHQRYQEGLAALEQQLNLTTPESRHNALTSLTNHNNFYLAYQGLNHLDLQQKYGNMVHKIMAANYPHWANPIAVRNSDNHKIKIGYISSYLHNHVVSKLTIGWLLNHQRDEFEINCYYLGNQPDKITEIYQNNCDEFYQISNNLELLCQQIINDQLDILVFLDLGMSPEMTMLAGLRLAPIQCTTWAHPETSGLPTIDYFISSELMEPENAQTHYSEKLIKLPNLGIYYPKPELPESLAKATDFGLSEGNITYLCPQSLFKYLPQYDYIFPSIAKKVSNATFVFLSRPNTNIAELFRGRLEQSFNRVGLNIEDYCLFLSPLQEQDYISLNLVADIFLDSFQWSGGHTTLEALSCNLPVVTCPGDFMRGRHTYGILQMLGVRETIAFNEQDYINIAVRLALDPQWRQNIKQKYSENLANIYDDLSSVKALERFYKELIKK